MVNKSQKFSSNSLNNNNLSCLSPRIPSPSVFLRTAWFPASKINFTPLFYHSSIYVVCRKILSWVKWCNTTLNSRVLSIDHLRYVFWSFRRFVCWTWHVLLRRYISVGEAKHFSHSMELHTKILKYLKWSELQTCVTFILYMYQNSKQDQVTWLK